MFVIDRKVELPHPGEAARAQILRIHSKKMKVDFINVNFEELARCTEDFNGAQMKAVAVESGIVRTAVVVVVVDGGDNVKMGVRLMLVTLYTCISDLSSNSYVHPSIYPSVTLLQV